MRTIVVLCTLHSVKSVETLEPRYYTPKNPLPYLEISSKQQTKNSPYKRSNEAQKYLQNPRILIGGLVVISLGYLGFKHRRCIWQRVSRNGNESLLGAPTANEGGHKIRVNEGLRQREIKITAWQDS